MDEPQLSGMNIQDWQKSSFATSVTTLNPRDGFPMPRLDGSDGTCRVYKPIEDAENYDKFWTFELNDPQYIDYVHVMAAAWEGHKWP